MPFKVDVSHHEDVAGMHTLALKWYGRVAQESINDELTAVIKEEAKKAVLADPEFREQIKEAIKAATLSLPLDVLAVAIKAAISEVTNAPKTTGQ